MKDADKTKEQLINELVRMHRRVAELEATETKQGRVEAALSQSEKTLRTITSNLLDGIFQVDFFGNVGYASPSFTKLSGYEPEELLGKSVLEFAHPDDKSIILNASKNDVERPEPRRMEFRYRHADGHYLWVESNANPLFDEEGQVTGAVIGIRDITDRKKVEEALRESEERYRTIFETAAVSIWEEDFSAVKAAIDDVKARGVTDFQSYLDEHPNFLLQAAQMVKVVDVNDATLKIFRANSKEELLGAVDKIFLPETLQIFRDEVSAIAEGRSFFQGETVNQTLQGERLNILLTMAIPSEADKFSSVLVSVMDITERMQAEQALRRAEEEIRQRATQLEALRAMGLELSGELDLETLLHSIVSRAIELLGASGGSLYLWQPKQDVLEQAVSINSHIPPLPAGTTLRRGEGLAGRVWETGAPLNVENYQRWEGCLAPFRDHAPIAVVGVPIQLGDKFLGVLDVSALVNPPQTFCPADVERLGMFATQAAIAVRNAHLLQKEREQRELAEALEAAAAAVSSTLNVEQVLDRILEQVERVVAGDAFNIMLIEDGLAQAVRWRGYERFGAEEFLSTVAFPVNDVPTLQQMVETGKPVILPDTSTDPNWFCVPGLEWLRSFVAAPIQVAGLTTGFLNVDGARPGQFGPDDAQRLKAFAAHAATAVEHAQLYRAVRSYAEQQEQQVQERTAQLRAQYARLDAILHSTADGIVVTDAAGEILQSNPVAHSWLTRLPSPQDKERVRRTVQDLVRRAAERPEATLELTGLDLALKAAPITEPEIKEVPQPALGEPAAVVTVHDVSQLKALDRMKTSFVTSISHQLRTPVANMKLYANLLQTGRRPEKTEHYLQVLENQADQLKHLVQDILEMTTLDSGQAMTSWQLIPLTSLIDVVVTRYHSQAQASNLALTAAPVPPDLPPVKGDPYWLSQAFGKLLENALTFTPAGGQVIVETGMAQEDERLWVTLAVRDTGPGVAVEEQQLIFDRFYRGSLAKAGHIPGSGLGLSVATEILRAHGGHVAVESQLDQGSTFTMWLPAAR